MPASPHLIDLLTQWTVHREEVPNRVIFQKELIEPAALAVNGNRLAMRERRRRDLRYLEDARHDTDNRWEERMERIEQWRRSVGQLQGEYDIIQRLMRSTRWLQKAHSKRSVFLQRFNRRAAILTLTQESLHEKLTVWEGMLQDKIAELNELKAKEDHSHRPLYMSRARKQPEIEFVQEHDKFNEEMGRCITELRASLNRARARVAKAFAAVDAQVLGSEILYEVHKQEIRAALQSVETTLLQHRDAILSDALVYEGCRHILKKINGRVFELRSLEEFPQPASKSWSSYWKN